MCLPSPVNRCTGSTGRSPSEIPPSYAEAIKAAGRIADNGTLSTLEKLSNHAELSIAKEATRALGGLGPDCKCFDVDFDCNVTLKDFAALQMHFGD